MSSPIRERLIGRLLWLANGDPPFVARQEFYAMKKRLLERYGRMCGQDVQSIIKHCYGCEGTGRYADSGNLCRRCGGDGIWGRSMWRLQRWELAGYSFHTPMWRIERGPYPEPTIVGRIRHEPRGRGGEEAALWLALAFDRRLFRTLMTRGWPLGPTWRYPLCTLRKVTGRLAHHGSRLSPRRCHCGRAYRQYPWERGSWCICRECRKPSPADSVEEIPF